MEFDRRLVKGSSPNSLIPSRAERALIQKNALSFLYRGDASDFGHYWMESTRQKTWLDVWRTTTQPLDSGDLGIDLIISGSFGSCLSMSHSIHLRKELNLAIISYRYLYVPLGGAKHAILATLTVFTFVALWHDLSLKLLTWGWVISLFVIPEMTAQKLVPSSQVR